MEIKISEETKKQMDSILKKRNSPQKIITRIKIVKHYEIGESITNISKKLDISRECIYTWLNRFKKGGLEGLIKEKEGRGRPISIDKKIEDKIIKATTDTTPQNAKVWSTRTLSKKLKLSHMTIYRIWNKFNLQPHRVKYFKISNDPNFAEKVRDIVGLYINPPEKTLVLSVDEKSQIQALDRTQPGLPLKPGRLATMTHDYKRHGTTTLFAALNTITGKVISDCMEKHTQFEFLKFLKRIDRETPTELDLHIIVDNYGAHKAPAVKKWLEKNKRFHMHYTPTSSSWINLVERFFSELTNKKIRRGIYRSVKELIADIKNFIKYHNDNPKIYMWTKDAETILNKVKKVSSLL